MLRARDYKSKKNRLRNLQEKIALRNKDEFYWGMVKGKTKVGSGSMALVSSWYSYRCVFLVERNPCAVEGK